MKRARYYGKPATKAQMAMDAAIWGHGDKKRDYTVAIKKLKSLQLKDKCVVDTIALLESIRKQLDKVELF